MKILMVHAHHEDKSFCSSLYKCAKSEFEKNGHEVMVSDLHLLNFDPVSDRRNFVTVKDAAYLKQQQEEMYASENGGFAQDLEAEMRKLESCDALIFSYPLWWFAMPAILKGWCDRVLAMGRIYGGGKFYERGLGESRKRAMLIATTGGGINVYDGWGLNPPMDSLLQPVQQGIFWFNGFLPLEPFVAWAPVRMSDDERKQCLDQLAMRINNFFEAEPIQLPLMDDFPSWGPDSKNRYQVVVRRTAPVDANYLALVNKEIERISELKRQGVVTDFQMSSAQDPEWRAFIRMRAADERDVRAHLDSLPLAAYLGFEITHIVPPKGKS